MRMLGRFSLGIIFLIVVVISVFYVDYELGKKVDRDACKSLSKEDVAQAVIKDVSNPINKYFTGLDLSPENVIINTSDIQVSSLSVMTPFKVKGKPNTQYFAISRCSVIDGIEYSEK